MFPNYYQPYPYPPYYQPGRAAQTQTGFVRVPSEDVARNWTVMPGTSVTFLDENQPYCYTKTVGISQLDGSKFEKYRLVKEEDAAPDMPERRENAPHRDEQHGGGSVSEYALKTELEALAGDVDALRRVVEGIVAKAAKKKGVKDDGEPAD